ncbi:hypothetical protein BDY24DRAFT_411747 [Mrakia frigida]|uniref:uncharacterized protein n=1 Tax=Mrakia frigida TaxID=29902 RepID=UPI003FCC1794
MALRPALSRSFSTSLGSVVSKPPSMSAILIELFTSDEIGYRRSTSTSLWRRVD